DQQECIVDCEIEEHLRREEAVVHGGAVSHHREEQRERRRQRHQSAIEAGQDERSAHAGGVPCSGSAGRVASARMLARNSADCSSITTKMSAALNTRFPSGGTPSE